MKLKIIGLIFILATIYGVYYKLQSSNSNSKEDQNVTKINQVVLEEKYHPEQDSKNFSRQKTPPVIDSEVYNPEDSLLSYQTVDEDNNVLRFVFDKKKKTYKFIKEGKDGYITEGKLPEDAFVQLQLDLEDQSVVQGPEDKKTNHTLYLFNNHLLYDTFGNSESLVEGRWFFRYPTLCPKVTEKNLKYLHLALAPHSGTSFWHVGKVHVSGAVVRSYKYYGFWYGDRYEDKNFDYRCSKQGVTIATRKVGTFSAQFSGDRIGVSRGDRGEKKILFKSQPFLRTLLNGTYSGILSGFDGVIGEVEGVVTRRGMKVAFKALNGDEYSIEDEDGDWTKYKVKPGFMEGKFKKNGKEGKGICMVTVAESDDPLNRDLIYCLGTFGRPKTTYGVLLRKDLE
jgi:hypothetical protein